MHRQHPFAYSLTPRSGGSILFSHVESTRGFPAPLFRIGMQSPRYALQEDAACTKHWQAPAIFPTMMQCHSPAGLAQPGQLLLRLDETLLPSGDTHRTSTGGHHERYAITRLFPFDDAMAILQPWRRKK
jgi:hypothetical protein